MGHYLIFHRHAHPQIVLANVSSSIFFFSFFSSEKLTMSFNVSTRTLKKSDGLRISLMCCMVILRKILLLVRLTNHEISNTLGKSKIVCFFPPTLSFLHFFFCFFKQALLYLVTTSTCHKLTKSGAFKLVNFTNATLNSDGSKECVNTTGIIEMYDKKPIHECLHKDVDQCHHTYVTEFEPIQEEVCDENYQKSCQVSSNIHSRKIIFIFHSTDLFIIKTCCTQVFAITFTQW